METLEKKVGDIEQVSLKEIKAMSIKKPTYETASNGEENRLKVYDMAEYSCDAGCKDCHCATY